VDDPAPVGVVRGAGQLLHQRGGLQGRRQALGKGFIQAPAVDVFQGEVGAAVLLADVLNLDNVGVV
jgi:hypothetical protein